ncbi:hypothetical protein Tco_0015146 [Tanacetum coccineum]
MNSLATSSVLLEIHGIYKVDEGTAQVDEGTAKDIESTAEVFEGTVEVNENTVRRYFSFIIQVEFHRISMSRS